MVMVAFVIAAVLLAVLALAFVLRPLWRAAPLAGIGALLTLVVLTGVLYLTLGTPAALDPAARQPLPETLDDAIVELEAKLAENPDQPEGWRLLGNAYTAQGRTAEAAKAFDQALEQAPDDPDLLTQLAQMRAMSHPERQFDAEALAMLEHAIEVDPMHQRARWFLGIARRQAGKPAEAVELWEPLLPVVDEKTAASLREQIDLARVDAGMPPLPAETARAPGVTVSVSLDPALGMRLPDNATVFVIARQPGGPPMPVAVKKRPASQLPFKVTLGDGDSPMPTMKLSQLDSVELVARISATGNAMPATGDFTSAPAEVSTGEGAVAALLIDQVIE
jgi:cytochrome c-type biogenesis protein CcmH